MQGPDHSAHLLDRVQEAFQEAILRSCGSLYADMTKRTSKKWIQICTNWRKSGDYQSKVAETIYRTHIAARRRETGTVTSVMVVMTESKLGWATERTYGCARELAEGIIACIPEEAMADVLSDVVVEAGGGAVVITTAPHMQWHLQNDRHPCSACGRFFQGAFGLRTHQVEMHGIEAQLVREKYLSHPLQMVVYTPPVPLLPQSNDPSIAEADCVCSPKLFSKDNSEAHQKSTGGGAAGVNVEILAAAKAGDLASLRALMAAEGLAPIDVSSCIDEEGNNPLTWAAGNGHLEMCRYLVESCGADPSAALGRRKRRRQAIHWSARNGQTHICEWLVAEHGVDVDATTENGTTPLHFAIWMGQHDCVKWLVEVGRCDVNKRNEFGCNAAHWAGFKGDVAILKYMHKNGLDFMHINHNRRSAIHKAAVKGNVEACEWLLTPVADGGGGLGLAHMQPELEGDTPITLAFSMGHFSLQDFLSRKYQELTLSEETRKRCSGGDCSDSGPNKECIISSRLAN